MGTQDEEVLSDKMDIGLPNVDIFGMINSLFEFIKYNGPRLFNTVLELCGGNPVVAGIVIGFPVYLFIDFVYHTILDKPAAALGERMMKAAASAALFIIMFFIVAFLWSSV